MASRAPVDKPKSLSDSGGTVCEAIRFTEDAARLRVPCYDCRKALSWKKRRVGAFPFSGSVSIRQSRLAGKFYTADELSERAGLVRLVTNRSKLGARSKSSSDICRPELCRSVAVQPERKPKRANATATLCLGNTTITRPTTMCAIPPSLMGPKLSHQRQMIQLRRQRAKEPS